jgi:hypothetical protein
MYDIISSMLKTPLFLRSTTVRTHVYPQTRPVLASPFNCLPHHRGTSHSGVCNVSTPSHPVPDWQRSMIGQQSLPLPDTMWTKHAWAMTSRADQQDCCLQHEQQLVPGGNRCLSRCCMRNSLHSPTLISTSLAGAHFRCTIYIATKSLTTL